MRISDWSSDVCSSDLREAGDVGLHRHRPRILEVLRAADVVIEEGPHLGRRQAPLAAAEPAVRRGLEIAVGHWVDQAEGTDRRTPLAAQVKLGTDRAVGAGTVARERDPPRDGTA